MAIAVGVGVLVTNSSAVTAPCLDPYIVQPGDNLWRLADVMLQGGENWVKLKEQNLILKDDTRYWTDVSGRLMVHIKPLEMLCGLEVAGVNSGGFSSPRSDTLKDLPLAPVEAAASAVSPNRDHRGTFPWWVLLALAAMAFAMWLLSRWDRKLDAERVSRAVNTDPATAGPPMVPGGVTYVTADQALREMAARRYGGGHQDFTILERTPGLVYGTMLTSYRDNTELPFKMTGQRAYQARIRHQNGHMEVIYMLQACGNDLKFGDVTRYSPGADFRFVLDAVAEAAVQTVTEVPAVVEAPIPVPVAEVKAQQDEVMAPGTVRVEVKPADDKGPNLVQVTGVNPVGTSFKLTPNGFEFRYNNLATTQQSALKIVK